MENVDDLTDALVVITLDEAAQQLCMRLHWPELCVRDSWATTGLGAIKLGAQTQARPRARYQLNLPTCQLAVQARCKFSNAIIPQLGRTAT